MDAQVLVVEDEMLVRWSLVDALNAAEGLIVFQASNGSSALDMMAKHPDIGFVVSDIHMPGKPDGLGLCQEIRSRYPLAAILLASGRGRPATLPPEVAYVDKPYDPDAIVDCVLHGSFSDPHCQDRLQHLP